MSLRSAGEPGDSLQLLADAGALLNSSLDYDRTLENVVGLVVPRFADWCTLDTVEDDERVHRFAVAAGDRALADLEATARSVDVLPTTALRGPVEVIRSGEPIFMPVVDDSSLALAASDEITREVYSQIGVVSLMVVPIAAKGLICGAITFITTDPARRYTAPDLLVARDIGQRAGMAIDNARHYEDIQRIAGELRRANEAKDEFLGMISHELRTPITVIYGGARVLRVRGATLSDDRKNALIADIEEEADRLHRIVEDLLALSRVQVDQDFQAQPVLLQRIIPQIAARFEHRHRREVRLDLDTELPPAAADEGYINQVLRNLLSNAQKYAEPGSPIEVVLERASPDECRVSVCDRGRGVTEEDIERIFERFYRSPDVASSVGGAGMGLAVCRRLVAAMSGQIAVEQRPGGGSVFWFTLPLYPGGAQ